jgi:hypothetical protein
MMMMMMLVLTCVMCLEPQGGTQCTRLALTSPCTHVDDLSFSTAMVTLIGTPPQPCLQPQPQWRDVTPHLSTQHAAAQEHKSITRHTHRRAWSSSAAVPAVWGSINTRCAAQCDVQRRHCARHMPHTAWQHNARLCALYHKKKRGLLNI